MEKLFEKNETSLHLDPEYKNFLIDIKNKLKKAQIRAALAANSELIKFYWELGTNLLEKQKAQKWGEHFLDLFSRDIQQAFPQMQGLSVRNLQRMKQFASLYPGMAIATQAVSQLPWGHITRLIQMVKNSMERDWYAKQALKNGWSRSVMEMQIESGLYERQGITSNKTTNYHEHLPAIQSDLARDILKDPYNKANHFKPEHTGQLGFYLAAVVDLMKKESDNPTIGILLCKSKSKIVAEYALRTMKAPIGISEYMFFSSNCFWHRGKEFIINE